MGKALLQKICIGTAQFGLDYGISNEKGQVAPSEITNILNRANEVGVQALDTASEYGDADKVIGTVIESNDLHFNIMAKSPKFSDQSQGFESAVANINDHIELSLKTLNIDSIDVFYIRNLDAFVKAYGEQAIAYLESLKLQSPINKIGVSVYDRAQINEILEYFKPDTIQIPFSILDQRLKMDGTLSMLSAKNIEIHVRSIFTQGLIFMSPNDLSPFFDPVKSDLQRIHTDIKNSNMTPLQAALHFIFSHPEISRVIMGVTSAAELEDIVTTTQNIPENIDWSSFALYDEHILNPQNWGKH